MATAVMQLWLRFPVFEGGAMSIEPKETCPPGIQTILEIWQATLVEAKVTNGDAISAGCMLMGFICMQSQETKDDALQTFSDTIYDIYCFIDQNWEQAEKMRQAARRRRGE
jgi:hypothetical protein